MLPLLGLAVLACLCTVVWSVLCCIGIWYAIRYTQDWLDYEAAHPVIAGGVLIVFLTALWVPLFLTTLFIQ